MYTRGSKSLLQAIGYKPFKQRFPWYGSFLQTIKSTFFGKGMAGIRGKWSLHEYPVETGILRMSLNVPEDTSPKGLVILCPGLGGMDETVTMHEYADAFVAEGFATLRLNYRGSGRSIDSCPAPFHGGLTEDLMTAAHHLPPEVAELPIIYFGYSLGGHLALKTLIDGGLPKSVIAGVSISAPLCLAEAQDTMELKRNWVYIQYLLYFMRRDLRETYGDEAMKIKSVREVDHKFIAPAFGYSGSAEYYEKASVLPHLSNLQHPHLVITAEDDPWIPPVSYRRAQWPDRDDSAIILSQRGGHMGFHSPDAKYSWSLDLAVNYMHQMFDKAIDPTTQSVEDASEATNVSA